MLNVITTNTNYATSDGDEFTVTTYSAGGYTLSRTEFPVLDRVAWKVRAPHELPSIVDKNVTASDAPKFGVNWSACGTQSSVDARAYAAQLVTAADAADVFNRIVANG